MYVRVNTHTVSVPEHGHRQKESGVGLRTLEADFFGNRVCHGVSCGIPAGSLFIA